MPVDWSDEEKQSFAVALQVLGRLQASLPNKVEAAKTSRKAKLPFFTACLRECLLYRVVELGQSTCDEIKAERLVSSAVLIRALLEAVALIILLDQRIREAVGSSRVEYLESLVSRGLVGCKNDVTPIEAINVLTILKHVTKQYDGFEQIYKELSEIAHPNWGGLLGAYGILNEEERLYELQRSKLPLAMVILPFRAALEIFHHAYNTMVPFLHQLVDVADGALAKPEA